MVLQRLMREIDNAKVTKKCHTCNSKMSIIEDFADFETIFAYFATLSIIEDFADFETIFAYSATRFAYFESRFAYFESREPF